MVYFMDGEVRFVDDGLGSTAYTSDHDASNNYGVSYGSPLHTANAVLPANCKPCGAKWHPAVVCTQLENRRTEL